MRPPCDEVVIRSGSTDSPCGRESGPWVLAATILASSMVFIDGTVVNVALPALQSTFHATVVDVQWVVESYGLFLAALILVGGALGDHFGRRLVFLLGVGIFALASAACGFSSNIEQLIIGRCVQGVGAALLVPGSLAIISACFEEEARGQAIGTWSGFTAITTALGPVLGGALIEHASWHWIFFINLPFAAVVVAISLSHIPESRGAGASEHVDWTGAVIATLGLAGVVYGFLESSSVGWSHPSVLGSVIVGIACLVAFVFVEARLPSPMVPLRLFKSRAFSGANLLTLFLYAALGIFFFLFPLNLIQAQGYSATATGAAALPMIVFMFLLSRWSGGLVARYGARAPLITGPLIAAAGFVLFAAPAIGGGYWETFFPAFVVLGLGMAVSVAPLTTVVMNSVGREEAGTASGINNAVSRVAGVLAIAILGIVMVGVFSFSLKHRLANRGLSPSILQEIQANEIRLAGLKVPSGLDANTSSLIRTAVSQAFVLGYRVVTLICAGLAVASAAVAWLVIPPNSKSPTRGAASPRIV
jgi:EmrB/QacA subfamily drug resistance transporter